MRVVLGVTGGIAAYKACLLLRLLTEGGHDVTVVPTAAALRFVGAPTWAATNGMTVRFWKDWVSAKHTRPSAFWSACIVFLRLKMEGDRLASPRGWGCGA